MVEVQEKVERSLETVKEVWNKPGFETIGVDMTANGINPTAADSLSVS